jgi:hypothetical protein
MNAVATEDLLPQAQETRSYLRETAQPIYSALLILPFLVVYELGLIFLRSDVINGGDAILLNLGGPLMRMLGMHGSLVSLLVLGIYFVVLQFKKSGSLLIRPSSLGVAFLECMLYGLLLFTLLGLLVKHLPGASTEAPRPRTMASAVVNDRIEAASATSPVAAAANRQVYQPGLKDFVLYCGAGIYEELVFRVLLLGLLMLVFTKLFHMEHAYAAVWSTVIGAVIFSAFHHIGGERFALNPFSQRVFAGVFFSALYFTRSFGVAAASHAFYDIFVGLQALQINYSNS